MRQFLTVADLHEDHLGRVMIGAASFVPASQGLADNIEEGVDPVSKGEPLLLMTVRFTPVGMGTTTVRIEGWDATLVRLEPSVVDPDRGKYEPLSLKEAEITVRGGDCPATPTPPPSATPEPTRFIPPTQTPVLWQTVEPLDALSAGRDDCPQDWVVYTDPQDRFSICYPSDLEAAASDVSLYAHIDRNVEENSEISVIVSWSEGAGQFYGPSSPETCEYYTSIVEGPLSSTFVETNIVGRMVPSCFTVGPIQSSLHGSIAVAEDGSDREGFVLFTLNFVASDLSRIPANGLSIVETLVVGAR